MSSVEDSQELEDLMDEYSTIPNYRDVPDNLSPTYLRSGVTLWKHQKQLIYLALQAEYLPPMVTKDGEVFYSRSGIVCMGTGTGKTRAMIGVANFSVAPSAIEGNIIATSLNVIRLNKKKRENLDCTVIVAEKKIMNDAWLNDLRKTYSEELSHFVFDSYPDFESLCKTLPEYNDYVIRNSEITNYVGAVYNDYTAKRISQAEFESQMAQFDPSIKGLKTLQEYINRLKSELEDRLQVVIKEKFIDILSRTKIFFVSNDSFYHLFEVFKTHTVSRLILDEPQNTTLTKQELFEAYIPDERLKKMRSAGIAKRSKSYFEESPARFIWYVSATPNLIADNDEKHYFNSWVSKNDFVINDYASNSEEDRLFPELSSRYVLKFPYSYILETARPDFKSLVNNVVLQCKSSVEVQIIREVLGDEFASLLDNGDYEGVIEKLSVEGSTTDILDATVQRLQINIKKHKIDMSKFDSNTATSVIERHQTELARQEKELTDLIRKIDNYRSKSHGDEECSICFEKLNYKPLPGQSADKNCVCHISCLNCFHLGCIKSVFSSANKTCPLCREPLRQEDFKLTFDPHGRTVEQQVVSEEFSSKQSIPELKANVIYNSKTEALKAILTTPMIRNGRPYHRSKCLLFVEFSKTESAAFDQIVKLCQECGYNVRIPFKVTPKAKHNARFPEINRCIVTSPSTDKTKITKEIEAFANSGERTIWIFRSGKESAGLNFPLVDTSIEYSDFKSHKQIRGRTLRLNRVVPIDLFRLTFQKPDHSDEPDV